MFLTWGIPRKWDYRKLENQRFKNFNWLLELNVNSPNFLIFSHGKSYLRNASKFVNLVQFKWLWKIITSICFLPLQERGRIVCWKTYGFLSQTEMGLNTDSATIWFTQGNYWTLWVLFSPTISYGNDYHSLRVVGRITWFFV